MKIKKVCCADGCEMPAQSKGACNKHYRRMKFRGSYNPPKAIRKSTPAIERMLSMVEKNRGPDGKCWEFTGTKNAGGYGVINNKNKNMMVHRFSWEHHNKRKIPDGLIVLHSCDLRPCCNPDHLKIGTHQDNMKDKIKKNRANMRKGESHPKTKLKKKQVLKIYKLLHEKGVPTYIVAEMFNTSSSTISAIKFGRSWSHVTGHEAIRE